MGHNNNKKMLFRERISFIDWEQRGWSVVSERVLYFAHSQNFQSIKHVIQITTKKNHSRWRCIICISVIYNYRSHLCKLSQRFSRYNYRTSNTFYRICATHTRVTFEILCRFKNSTGRLRRLKKNVWLWRKSFHWPERCEKLTTKNSKSNRIDKLFVEK